jgi:hypothetical protein
MPKDLLTRRWTIEDFVVGDVVHFYSRDEWVLATAQHRSVEPIPAVLLRKHRSPTGQYSGIASLMLFTEGGARVAQARFTEMPTPDAWTFTGPTILEGLIRSIIEERFAEEERAQEEAQEDEPEPIAQKRPPPKKRSPPKKRVAGGKKKR